MISSQNFPLYPLFYCDPQKGQIISEGLVGILNSSKKRVKKSNYSTMMPHVDLFFRSLVGRIEDTKESFRNQLTFSNPDLNKN